jgi:AcrR family transcriptional regulator
VPPIFDKQVEKRILRAAKLLWRSRGEKGLTLRAVARKAGTTTPTLYQRFPNKKTLEIALARHLQNELNVELLASSATVEELCRRYIQFVERHPQEYKLIRDNWTHVFGPGQPRPLRAWVLNQLATRFGGRIDDYSGIYYALFFLVHGGATMLTIASTREARREMKENSIVLCDWLLQNVDGLSGVRLRNYLTKTG